VTNEYRSLAGRIRAELEELSHVAERIQRIWRQAESTSDDYLIDAAALNLHSFYSGLERIFELTAEQVDRHVPGGAAWRQELLRQMAAEVPGVRPPVLTPQLRAQLDRYRGFRHVVRNVYTYNLDAEQVAVLIRQLPAVADGVNKELTVFAAFLEDLLARN
jgi:hypothetical protein